MNPDLYMRLKPFHNLTSCEQTFWRVLVSMLSKRAMCYADALDMDMRVTVNLGPIENGEDDSAYMLGDQEGNFEIYIDDRMPFGMMIDFLIHELAHVQSWFCDEEDDHGPEFGIAYADLYNYYILLYEKCWCEGEN